MRVTIFEDGATVIWDRHNLIHANGPMDRYIETLRRLGFREGAASVPVHEHRYRLEYDADARAVLDWCAWRRTPLRPADEQ